ncbi:hypothetical protein NXX75_25495 [Bacteroides faecis]|nr:TonB-dependent receptor plug domain-containing protein [Bacteroides faecis]MCS2237562.1 hypothetical protein [Bacteroides faecis]
MAGNVPGIIARQTSGQPGKSTSEFWIRGILLLERVSSAYILVDGFERSSLDELNIEDIESFTFSNSTRQLLPFMVLKVEMV